jgi:hypothetical protein
MNIDRNYGGRSTAVMFASIMLVSIAAVMALSLKNADMPARVQWGAVYFACLIAPALTSWITWVRLKRYIPSVPPEAKRLLLGAAATFILLGLYAFLLAMGAAGR